MPDDAPGRSLREMARDAFIQGARCAYCGRPARLSWDNDLATCHEEVCKALGYAERHRRHGHRLGAEQRPADRFRGTQRQLMRARTVPLASKGHKRPPRG
jgi:Zn ribbon nucleic-acid-binding protein